MSQTFCLACDATQEWIWIGQGRNDTMTTFYRGPVDLEQLMRFLNVHRDMPLRFLCQDTTLELTEDGWKEFEAPETERWGNEMREERGA
jgi:hypothetical protein